jgi:hypothetical protein
MKLYEQQLLNLCGIKRDVSMIFGELEVDEGLLTFICTICLLWLRKPLLLPCLRVAGVSDDNGARYITAINYARYRRSNLLPMR